eukprot:SAG31_NODE_33831_length_339_cov_1.275000_1_plen_112_part_11
MKYRVEGRGGQLDSSWYVASDLEAADDDKHRLAEAEIHQRAIDSLGFLNMSVAGLSSLAGHERAKQLGITLPQKFIGSGSGRNKQVDALVVAANGMPCGRCDFAVRKLLLRE